MLTPENQWVSRAFNLFEQRLAMGRPQWCFWAWRTGILWVFSACTDERVSMNADENNHSGLLGRVAVVGAGAVGGYYGAKLARAGEDVAFLSRTHCRRWREDGITVRSVDGDFRVPEADAHERPETMGPADWVIIAIKATANHLLPGLLAPLVGPGTRLLTLQNGLGNDDLLAGHFGPERVLGGLCFTCINRTPDGVIHHLGQGHITLGEYQRPAGPDAARIAEAFNRAGVPARASDCLEALQWRKLVWNIPFNGLAVAEGGLDTEALLAMPEGEERTRTLMKEVIAVAARLGHEFPADLIDQQISVTRTMGAYRPSSLIDFLEGRPVETEAIWGEPLRRARSLGVPTPALEALHRKIRGIRDEQRPTISPVPEATRRRV
jgi:2-dehydropantoate 2-reductase